MIDARHLNTLERPIALAKGKSRELRLLLILAVIHVPLGVLIYGVGSLALLHPYGALAVGLYWAMQKHVKLERVAIAIAYIVGAEVLWRMAQVPVFWEFGKYGSGAIAIVALVRRNRFHIPKLPLFYFLMLLPACLLTLTEMDAASARGTLSSILSGPVLMFICCWFFSNLEVSVVQLRRMFLALIVPLISVASATLFYTVTLENIQFSGESNFATSGGFGPNQVSAALGLGALTALMCFVLFKNNTKYKFFFVAVSVLFAAQSIMTFSRGGMYNAAGAIIVVVLFQFRDPRSAVKRVGPLIVLAILFAVLVFPVLNNFTGGSLQERFEDTGTTHRIEIVQSDFEIFWENPILGVGVGLAYDTREKILDFKAMSHTEFTRLISEHGLFGVGALLCLVAMLVGNIRRQRSVVGQSAVAGAGIWCMLFMVNTGMRLAAPSFMLGLTFVTLVNRGFRVQTRNPKSTRATRQLDDREAALRDKVYE